MGLKMKLTPANVDCGLACSQSSPDHTGSPLGTAEALAWRMATAFGFPGRARGEEDVSEVVGAYFDLIVGAVAVQRLGPGQNPPVGPAVADRLRLGWHR